MTERLYTLIAHKPASEDYCMGSCMAAYSGGFEIERGLTMDDLTARIAVYETTELGHGELGWDCYVTGECDDADEVLTFAQAAGAQVRADILQARAAAKANIAAKKLEAERRATEQRERAEYARLAAKLGKL